VKKEETEMGKVSGEVGEEGKVEKSEERVGNQKG
jgi:hypothetical protein